MKAARVKPAPQFEPINIIIETKEEADHLWHLLNMSWGETKNECYNDKGIVPPYTMETTLWGALDKVYRPEGE